MSGKTQPSDRGSPFRRECRHGRGQSRSHHACTERRSAEDGRQSGDGSSHQPGTAALACCTHGVWRLFVIGGGVVHYFAMPRHVM